MSDYQYVRFPTMAGKFYSNDPETLSERIDQFLETAAFDDEAIQNPRILIVPHAGYMYSGQVAATGFAHINPVTRVILLGVSHHEYFSGATLYWGDLWRTPLGSVPVDKATVEKLEALPHFRENSRIHQSEHGLEVQLPFLQKVLDEFSIVPILLSQMSKEVIDDVAQTLFELMDEQTLLVVSTDLSHYPCQEDAERVDRQTILAILSGDIDELEATIDRQMGNNIPNLGTCACGATAVKVAMRMAQLMGLEDARLLQYMNSGDVSGSSSRVVGYAAIAFG
jgi:AmmeMemoRadiSam system protein B